MRKNESCDMVKKYGEEYEGDSKFVADCRNLQSIYRIEKLQDIRPYKGRDGKLHYYGNYIYDGEESGANFLTKYTFDYAKERTNPKRKKPYETIDSDRLFNNLLSSQPMAFNLFCPLRQMLEKSPEILAEVIKAALPNYGIGSVKSIELEFIPHNYKDLTGDRSAMDAIITYTDTFGRDAFIAIETKYSENLGTNVAFEQGTKEPRKQTLKAVKRIACFTPDIEELINKGKIRLTQIYRNFLLSEMYGIDSKQESYSIVLAPHRHPSTDREVSSLSQVLRSEYKKKICSLSLEVFVDRIIGTSPEEYKLVFELFKDRYLNFDKLKIADNGA